MKTTIHTAESRGKAEHGWLHSNHSFSFASYYNPDRMGYGLLRVLNDDVVAPSRGFSTHPHTNMEIVSIPLSGALQHKDSEGNETVIKAGEVQLMSAGKGVFHSEYNHSDKESVNFLQIWVMPEKIDIAPRYDQAFFPKEERKNRFQMVVSPLGEDKEGIRINQQAYFLFADLEAGSRSTYHLHFPEHGAYVFMLNGEAEVAGAHLEARDAVGVQETASFEITAIRDAEILVIEVPLSQQGD